MKKSELRTRILQIIWSSECYGYEIHKKLARQGIKIDIGRLYRVLNGMSTEGSVHYRWEKSKKGPRKRIYILAEKGRIELDNLLREAIAVIHKFYSEYLTNLPKSKSVFEAFARIAMPQPIDHCTIGFLAKHPSHMHGKILASLRNRTSIDNIYVVYPEEVQLNINLENVTLLNGDYDDVPVRRRHINLLIVDGLPSSRKMLTAAEEWHRVIQKNGRFLLITPSAHFSPRADPLSIGEFIEKIEHRNRQEENMTGEHLMKILGMIFEKVERREMLQMTFVIACKPRSAIKLEPHK